MADLVLKGKLTEKRDEEQITDSFSKRDFCMQIDLDTQYPQEVKLTLIKDKCSLIDKFSVGDEIEADINVRGRRVTLKKTNTQDVFNELNVWRVRGNASGAAPMPTAEPTTNSDPAPASAGDNDDLPF